VLTGDLDDVAAVVAQPIATVLSALDRLPSVAGRHAAVIGLGPLGLLIAHALKARGAAIVTGVDRVDRRDVGARFGLDRVVWDASHHWATTIDDDDRPDLIVEAVGHQVATLNDAIEAARVGADLYAFGVPDSTHYPIAFQRFFRKLLHLHGGNIQDWKRYLAEAEKYLIDHPDLPRDYVTDVFPVDRAQEAFESAVRPAVGRLKVALIPPLI
ncbi:MAG TPA: zinc-binding dehydrogenase, partial [Micromonosporaceae bacterium]